MNRPEEHVGAAAQQQIDFAATFATIEATRNNLRALRDSYQNQVIELEEADAKRSQEVLELNAAHEAQVQKLDAASAAQSLAYNELRIAHEKLTEAHLAQYTQLAALTAEVAELKAANQTATHKVACLESAAASQRQAYKKLEAELIETSSLQDDQSKVLIRVNAVKNAQAQELAKLKASHQDKAQQQAQVDNLERKAATFEAKYEAERRKVVDLNARLETVQQGVGNSAEFEALNSRFAGLTRVNESLLHDLESAKMEMTSKIREVVELRSSNTAHVHRIVELEETLDSNEEEYEELARAHYDLESELADLNFHLEFQARELKQLRSEKQRDDLSKRYDQLNSSFIKLDAENKSIQAEHNTLNTSFSKLQTDQVKLKESYEQLQVELRGAQQTKAYQTRLAKRLGEENAQLRSDYDRLQSETGQADQLSGNKRKVDESYWEPYLG